MKSSKEKFFVKTVYAYFNLFTKIYPLILLRIIGNSVSGKKGQGLFPSVDFFNLFSNEPEFFSPYIVPWWVSTSIIISNLLVFSLTYFMIIKLNQFLKNSSEENPFIKKNGEHLKVVGIITIILAVFLSLKDVVIKSYLIELSLTVRALLMPLNFLMLFFSPYFIIGMFTYMLGEICTKNAKMKEELELTV
ncbi:MAG: DUF2975 domain-containing protein [Bacteroidota bacterium]|nr:DUF2975 domain-containing protein [Bacteroidota bacterium]